MTAGRWELLRALGAVADNPADAGRASRALALPCPDAAEHTEVFVLNCPPYASVYLGGEGGLGGEGTDRVAGFWRAIGITPPGEPDHLAALLSLYAALGEAGQDSCRPAITDALTRARHTLLAEHLWPWLPAYTDAVAGLGTPALAGWARLAGQALLAEYRPPPSRQLPLAQRAAPPPAAAGGTLTDLLDTLTVPVRSGFILTRRSLVTGARDAGAGYRIGERQFTLRAMIEQAPAATFSWLAAEAGRWSQRHTAWAPGDPVQQWWARRAAHTRDVLHAAAAAAGRDGAAPAQDDAVAARGGAVA
jgi:nitrate reductase delta subunit